MRKRIFRSMCLLAFITVLLSSVLISGVMYRNFYNSMKKEVKNEAIYIGEAINHSGNDYLASILNKTDTNRITLIESDGTVLFDNAEKPEVMSNHLDRPEISDAFKKGYGESERLSQTLGSQTFYYAVLLDNKTVIRVASTVSSVYSAVVSCIPYMLAIAVIVFFLAMLFARRQTRKIIVPINSLDLENPLSNDIYDELSPLLIRISKQNIQIENQMKRLKEKQEEFTAITENMSEGLVILSNKAAVLSINQSAVSIFDIKRNEYLNKHILTVNRSAELQTAVEKAISGISWEEILPISGHQYQLIASPVMADGTVKGVVLLIMDVTDKIQAEKMRREFSANVSHELKTPLTSIFGYAEIMKNGLVKQEDMRLFSERIYSEAGRLINLIEDIIQISQLDENKVELPRENVNLLSLSKEVCDSLMPQAKKKGIDISVKGDNSVVYGVRKILEEIVYNLCDNAIKYNKENGRVDILTVVSENNIVLSVSDTGIGIQKEYQDRIFERFFRVDKSHSKETGGTGLGLSIVKHGANFHNAKLELESEPQKGTTIRLLFPINNY